MRTFLLEPTRSSLHLNSRGGSPSTTGRRLRRLAVVAASLGLPALVAVVLAQHLREGFGMTRLVAKSLLPFATLLPLAVLLRPRALRQALGMGLVASTAGGAMVLCYAVFGTPLEPGVLAGLYRLHAPHLAGLALLASLAVVALRAGWAGARWWGLPVLSDALFAGVEAVYFGGFLLGATGHLGLPALLAVAGGQALVAGARGVGLGRALGGAAVLVVVAWASASAYAALAAHLLLLGSPETTPTWTPRRALVLHRAT